MQAIGRGDTAPTGEPRQSGDLGDSLTIGACVAPFDKKSCECYNANTMARNLLQRAPIGVTLCYNPKKLLPGSREAEGLWSRAKAWAGKPRPYRTIVQDLAVGWGDHAVVRLGVRMIDNGRGNPAPTGRSCGAWRLGRETMPS
jgi:hypothetical protein